MAEMQGQSSRRPSRRARRRRVRQEPHGRRVFALTLPISYGRASLQRLLTLAEGLVDRSPPHARLLREARDAGIDGLPLQLILLVEEIGGQESERDAPAP